MARTPESVESAIECLIRDMESEGYYSKRTLRFYREQCTHVFQILDRIHPGTIPKKVTREMVMDVYGYMRREGYAVSTQKNYLHGMRRLCEASYNRVFDSVRIPFQTDERPMVDWLTYDQATALLRCQKTPIQELIISLELCHGLRRCEVLRLKVSDCHDGYLDVTGKGRGGGKLRSIPLHPDFPRILADWMSERDEIVKKARAVEPYAAVPDSLLIWRRGGRLSGYSDVRGSGIDSIVGRIEVDFGFSNHTLRRTFGREMYRSGVDLVTIARIMGHKSTDQTLEYLGLALDDMTRAMAVFRLR